MHRSLSLDDFNKVYTDCHARCFQLVNSHDVNDKMAGVIAIGQ